MNARQPAIRPAAVGAAGAKNWFSVRDAAGETEIYLYDDIIAGSAKAFITELKACAGKAVRLRINSPGGDVFDGLAIYNALRNHPHKVTVSIEGIAASAASVVAMAGKEIRCAGNAFLMMHNPHALCIGTAKDMREVAEMLDHVRVSLVAAYRRSGKTDAEIGAMMDAETWFTAEEARQNGLVDYVDAPIEAAAKHDLSRFRHPPKQLATAAQWDRIIAAKFPAPGHGSAPSPGSGPGALWGKVIKRTNAG